MFWLFGLTGVIFAGVVVNWGMMVSETEQKIGRGKLQVSTSERKYGSQVSLWGKNNYLLPYFATIWLSSWLLALSAATYLDLPRSHPHGRSKFSYRRSYLRRFWLLF